VERFCSEKKIIPPADPLADHPHPIFTRSDHETVKKAAGSYENVNGKGEYNLFTKLQFWFLPISLQPARGRGELDRLFVFVPSRMTDQT